MFKVVLDVFSAAVKRATDRKQGAQFPTGADVVPCLKDLKVSTKKKCLVMINICKTAKYKIAQKSVTFLRNNNEHAEKLGKKVSFTTVSKNETECLELRLRR